MMEDRHASFGSLFGGGSALSSGGLSRGGGASQLSPYLNVDPSYLSTQSPEFIFNQVREGKHKVGLGLFLPFLRSSFQDQKRGRMENSFTAIGSSVLLGAAAGGIFGLYDGVRQTAAAEMKGKLRRTQITNYMLKSGENL